MDVVKASYKTLLMRVNLAWLDTIKNGLGLTLQGVAEKALGIPPVGQLRRSRGMKSCRGRSTILVALRLPLDKLPDLEAQARASKLILPLFLRRDFLDWAWHELDEHPKWGAHVRGRFSETSPPFLFIHK